MLTAQDHLRSTVMLSVGDLLDDCRTRLSDLWEQLLAEIQMREAAEFQQLRLEREIACLREELGMTPLEPAADAAELPQPSTPVRGGAGAHRDDAALGNAGSRPERAAKASPRLSALASALRLRKPTKGRGGKPTTGPASASVERAPAGLPLGNASAGTSEESAATASPDDHGAVESISEPQLVSGSGRTTAPASARGDGQLSTFTSPHVSSNPTPSSPSRRTSRLRFAQRGGSAMTPRLTGTHRGICFFLVACHSARSFSFKALLSRPHSGSTVPELRRQLRRVRAERDQLREELLNLEALYCRMVESRSLLFFEKEVRAHVHRTAV